MSDIAKPQGPKVDSVEQFIALNPGEFWRALVDGHRGSVLKGHVLMIQQIDEVEGELHTIHVRVHPSLIEKHPTKVKYLVDDFLESFEFVPKQEAELIRQREIEAIQNHISESQSELNEACADIKVMDRLVEQELPALESDKTGLPVKYEAVGADIVGAVKTQKVSALMTQGLTPNGIEQIKSGLQQQKDIVVRRAEWLQLRTNRLSTIAKGMTPYFEEKAALALAVTQEMRDHVDGLMKGIGSLNLYVLKNVGVQTLKEGSSADPSEKLTITQRVLYMDEELAVWADVHDDWDFTNTDQFLKELAENRSLVAQIFPTERCVVSIAATRKWHDYLNKGHNSISANQMDQNNQRQFLLIRDGENLHLVLSPELFHNYSMTLFPTTNEMESPFRGLNGKDITYTDLQYTDSLREYEHIALSYKRLLILLCGLDHNKGLFGDFYPGPASLEFVSLGFQEKYFNFIHDVEGKGLLSTRRPPTVDEWIKKLNREIGSGSRVLVQWRNAFSVRSIPSCYERDSRWHRSESDRSLEFTPIDDKPYYRGVVRKRSGKMIMEIPVEGSYRYGELRSFKANLDIDYVLQYEHSFAVLCIDRLHPEDVEWYLHDRPSRKLNVAGIRMLKYATEWAREERERTQAIRTKLENDLLDAQLVDGTEDANRMVTDAIAKWQCANPSKDLNSLLDNPRSYNRLCNQLFQLSDRGEDLTKEIIKAEESLGKTVVRISILANGKYAAYSTPLECDRDDRLIPFYWLEQTTYKTSKSGLKAESQKFVILKQFVNDETVKYQRDDLADYIPELAPFPTPNSKAKHLDAGNDFREQYDALTQLKGNRERITHLIQDFVSARRSMTSKANNDMVKSPVTIMPVGHAVTKPYYHSDEREYLRFGFWTLSSNLLAWLVEGDDELTKLFIEVFPSIYENRDSAKARIESRISDSKGKSLHEIINLSVLSPKGEGGLFEDEELVEHNTDLQKDTLFSFSYQKQLDNLLKKGWLIYIEDDNLDNLDGFFGVQPPEGFRPLMVKQENGRAESSTVHIFEYDQKVFEDHEREFTTFSSMKSIKGEYKNTKYTTHDSGKQYIEIKLEWEPIETVERYGVPSVASYGYRVVSKTPRNL